MTLVEKTNERGQAGLVEDGLLQSLQLSNLLVVLGQRPADHLPHVLGLQTVEARHCVVFGDPLCPTRVDGRVEIRLEARDSHACDRLVTQASEDINDVLPSVVMFVPVGRLHFAFRLSYTSTVRFL